jgi:predicted DNA-binding protein (UPF0251 family)
MHRRRRGGRGRFPIQPNIRTTPVTKKMNPEPAGSNGPIFIDLAETEAIRLVDLEGMYQEQAGAVMGVSRGTIWRLLSSAREKVARSIYEGRPLIIGQVLEKET